MIAIGDYSGCGRSDRQSFSEVEVLNPVPDSKSPIIYPQHPSPPYFRHDCPRWASSSPGDDRVTPKAITLLLGAPVLLFAMVAHEYAHGYAAHKQGDDTAKLLGRLSWNPLRHIDPFMTVILPVVMFYTTGMALGGAKPVPVDPRNYRNYRSGDIIVSLAGIVTNLLLAALLVPAIVGLGLLGQLIPGTADTLSLVQLMFRLGIFINLLLAVFNLMPLPPLDGSHVVKHFLPAAWALHYQRVARFGFVILILMLMFGGPMLTAWMAPAIWLDRMAMQVVSPYILLSPWTTS